MKRGKVIADLLRQSDVGTDLLLDVEVSDCSAEALGAAAHRRGVGATPTGRRRYVTFPFPFLGRPAGLAELSPKRVLG